MTFTVRRHGFRNQVMYPYMGKDGPVWANSQTNDWGPKRPFVYLKPEPYKSSLPEKNMVSKSRRYNGYSSSSNSTVPNGQRAMDLSEGGSRSKRKAGRRTLTIGPTPTKRGRITKKVGAAYVRNFGASNSKSGGFFKTRRKIKRKSRVANMFQNGCFVTKETGGLLTSDYSRYIGHASFGPIELVRDMTFLALVKHVLFKSGFVCKDMDDALTAVPGTGVASADIFTMHYKLSHSSIAYLTHSIGVTTKSLKDMGDEWAAWYQSVATTDLVLVSFTYKPDNAANAMSRQVVHLDNAKVNFDIKSTLKLQNRSVNSTGNDSTDDVDNVPLYGKSYMGKGTGTTVVGEHGFDTDLYPFIADRQFGIINHDGIYTRDAEPLAPETVLKATRTGKAKLDPGEIKTDVLSYKGGFNLNTFLTKTIFYTGPYSEYPLKTIGNFKFFGLEKMLEVYPYVGEDPPELNIVPFIIAFERNFRIGCAFTPGRLAKAQSMKLASPVQYQQI